MTDKTTKVIEAEPLAIDDDEAVYVNIDEIDVGVNEQPMEVVSNEVEIYSENNPVSFLNTSVVRLIF